VARALRQAHLGNRDLGERTKVRGEVQPDGLAGEFALASDAVPVGADGTAEVQIDLLAVGGLGLTGPGAAQAARHLVVALLATGSADQPDQSTELVIPIDDLAGLLDCSAADLPSQVLTSRLTVTAGLDEAMTQLEAELLRRARIIAAHQADDLSGLRHQRPEEEPLPPVVLVATPNRGAAGRLHALFGIGASLGVGGILLGTWPNGLSCQVAADGHVTASEGAGDAALVGVRLFGLASEDASDLLALLQQASGMATSTSDNASAVELSAAEGPTGEPEESPAAPVSRIGGDEAGTAKPERCVAQVQVLGSLRISAEAGPVTSGLRTKARELLIFLAVRPEGVTASNIVETLWPSVEPRAAVNQFRTALGNLRAILRKATGQGGQMFVNHVDGNYQLDPELIDVDLWRFQRACLDAVDAVSTEAQESAWREAVDVYGGDLTETAGEWAEPAREALRRRALDAHVRLAELLAEAGDSDSPGPARGINQALDLLDQALVHDPYNEALYVKIMHLQARAGRPEAIQATLRLLTTRLADIDAEPAPETLKLAAEAGRPGRSG
jgi:DNA-binding SARP family transcriptional activator